MVSRLIIKPCAIVPTRTDPDFLSGAAIVVTIHANPSIVCNVVIKPISIVIPGSGPDFLDYCVIWPDANLDSGFYHGIDRNKWNN